MRDGSQEDFEYQGRPYKSLSAIARQITGTRGTAGLLRPQETRRRMMKQPLQSKLRCAVYTRKSTEEGLDMEFNSPRRPARGL